jgi:hypothetical protein
MKRLALRLLNVKTSVLPVDMELHDLYPVLTYGAETWSLYEDDRRGADATEMDPLRRPARISKLGGKTNDYI